MLAPAYQGLGSHPLKVKYEFESRWELKLNDLL